MISTPDKSRYRWYILFLAMLTYGSIAGAARLCMPVLFPEISEDLGLSMVAIGTIWGMDPLAGVFLALPGGLLADRIGIKRVMTVVCILAGLFGALRGFSLNFFTMALFMFLFGLTASVIPSIIPKVTAVWFSGKHLSLVNGLIIVSWSIGAVIATLSSATLLSPWLGGWQVVLYFFGVPPVIFGLLWCFTGRERDDPDISHAPLTEKPFKTTLTSVIKMRNVWIMSFVLLAYWGGNMGFQGYLPTYLRNIGWEPAIADVAMTVMTCIGVFGVMPIVLISNKIGTKKPIMIFSVLVVILSIGLIPLVNTLGIWILLVVGGLLRSGVIALANTAILEIKEVGGAYGGTAIGLMNTLGMLGAFASPPIGNSLTFFSDGAPLFFWAAMDVIALPLLLMFRENRSLPKTDSLSSRSWHS